MKEKIIIFGSGQIAEIANFYFERDSNFEICAFTVDKEFIKTNSFKNKPVIPVENLQKEFPKEQYKAFIALSYRNMNKVREKKFNLIKNLGYDCVNYISSKCNYLSDYSPGENCFILEDNTIQPFVKIGNNVTIWSGNHVGHHSSINDHNFISSHVVISGNCSIDKNCFLGVNATIHNNVKIAKECILGAGAVIQKDTQPKSIHLPAKGYIHNKKSDEIEF